MELLKLSKFKLQLKALATEVGDLREREQSATEQCRILIQRQKQTEEEYCRQLQELQSELASSNELRQKLQKKKLLTSLDTDLEREAFSIKQLVDRVQLLVSEKEEVVAGLRSKMDKVSAFEKVFFEKIRNLENRLKNDEEDFRRKDRIISELEEQLEAAKLNNSFIQNLISEKEALHCEVRSLAIILQKIQETVVNMNEQDKKIFSSLLECQEDCDMIMTEEGTDRVEDLVQNSGEPCPNKASSMGIGENRVETRRMETAWMHGIRKLKHKSYNSKKRELSVSPCSDLQSAANSPNISVNNAKTPGISVPSTNYMLGRNLASISVIRQLLNQAVVGAAHSDCFSPVLWFLIHDLSGQEQLQKPKFSAENLSTLLMLKYLDQPVSPETVCPLCYPALFWIGSWFPYVNCDPKTECL
ncbi:unnamed protein product [Dovyalis caffra]|uniref:Uncharacterized protein n=1 Tax=Dovyalis caffra TaxID=77055 RepID=A0AAV1RCQ5_9ROSI|nr:unnamed protein product [Dovyalis caffra]